jgi:hypothetical protein
LGETYKLGTKVKNLQIKEIHKIQDSYDDIDLSSIFSFDNREVIDILSRHIYSLRELFESYAIIGDKMNSSNITVSGFLKFLRDLNIIEKGGVKKLDMTTIQNTSRSPWKSGGLSRNSSALITPRKNNTSINIIKSGGTVSSKVKETDAEIIFNSLCGIRHFDMEKSKHYFNKNKGMIPRVNDHQFGAKLDNDRKSLAVNKSPIVNRMNFFLFLKSFEQLSHRLYPTEEVDAAVLKFMQQYLENLLTKESTTLKRNILEQNAYLKRDEIVKFEINLD